MGKTTKPKERRNRTPYLILFLFSFLLYGQTLTYDYTLDDLIVIRENSFTQKGIEGLGGIFGYDSFTGFFGTEKQLVAGGRYRPLSIATFAIEYQVAGGFAPALSHLINILLYGLTGVLIMIVFNRLFPPAKGRAWYLQLPFITAMLFLAHPVHTEVVANIKGRDEILALLLPLAALYSFIRYFETGKLSRLATANLLFFLGLLSKENAILFALIIPLSIHFFTRVPWRKNLTASSTLIIAALLFVFIRFLVLGYLNSGELPKELLNNPFLDATAGQKAGTILYTLGLYIKLLFFPLTLTHDYYPYHIPLVSLTDLRSLVPLVLYTALIIYAIVRFTKKEIPVFGILFYLLTLFIVSNILFPVGTFMNERFIYMPSLGFVLLIAWLLTDLLPRLIPEPGRYKRVSIALASGIILFFTVRTVARNPVWKDNFTLFTTDVLVSENSVKCNVSAGGDLQKKAEAEPDTSLKRAYYQRSIRHLEKAISIYPRSVNGLLLYGNVLATYRHDYKAAIDQYLKILAFDPYNGNASSNAVKVLNSLDSRTEASYKRSVLKKLVAINANQGAAHSALGKLYGQVLMNADSAALCLEKAVEAESGNPAHWKDLGIAYSMQGKYEKAMGAFTSARNLDPNDPQILQNMQITNQLMAGRKASPPPR